MKRKLFLLFTISLFFNCVAKKVSFETKTTTKKDSIYSVIEKKVVDRAIDTVFIDSPCDSLGNLKPFKYSFSSEQGKVSLFSLNNSISGNIDLKGYEVRVEKKYRLIYEKKASEFKEKKVTNRVPLWSYIYMVLVTLIVFILLRVN